MKKINRNMVLNWNREWTWVQDDDLLKLFILILNSEYYNKIRKDVTPLRNEILEYNKENCNEENY